MATWRELSVAAMSKAVEAGISFAAYYRDARAKDIAYPRAAMRDDWHDAQALVERATAFEELERGEYPELEEVSESRFDWNKPYVYMARVGSAIMAGMPLSQRFATVTSSEALTVEEIEELVKVTWPEYEYEEQVIGEIAITRAVRWTGGT